MHHFHLRGESKSTILKLFVILLLYIYVYSGKIVMILVNLCPGIFIISGRFILVFIKMALIVGVNCFTSEHFKDIGISHNRY